MPVRTRERREVEPGQPAPVLVGRSAELARLGPAAASPPAVVVVEGEAGIGKTRLIAELRDRDELAGRWFAVGLCRQVREPFPLGPVLDAVRELGGALAPAHLSPVAGALRPLLPELGQRLPPRPEPLADRLDERHRVFRGLVEVLTAGPAVVVLEDLHWADEQTIEFLGYLLATPPPELTLVATFRGDQVDPRVPALTAKLPEPVCRIHATLTPLDVTETGTLAAALLGVESVAADFAEQLWERTAGLPFAIEEVLALPRVRAAMTGPDGRWQHRVLSELDVPDGIRDPIRERLSHLSADARSVAEAAAVLRVPVPVEVLAATSPLPRARARRGLAEALTAGLLVEQPGGIGLRHLLAAQTVYEGMPLPRRQDLHARAAAALHTVRPPRLGQVADHLHHAAQRAHWAAVAEQAVDQAIGLGHDAEAARLLEQLLREASLPVAKQGQLALKLARTVGEGCPDGPGVLALLTSLLELELPPVVRGELRFWLVTLHERAGSGQRVLHRLLAGAVDDLGNRRDLYAWAAIGLACLDVPGPPTGRRRTWLDRALAVVGTIPDRPTRGLLWGKAAMVLIGIGDPAGRLIDQVMAQSGELPQGRREVGAYLSMGIEAGYTGQYGLAGKLLAAGVAGAVAGGHRPYESRGRAGQALLDYFQGSWDGLAGRIDNLIGQQPNLRRIDELHAVAGALALARGELDEAQHRLRPALVRFARRGAADYLPIPGGAWIRLALARGEVAEAVATARQVLGTVDPVEPWVTIVRALPAVTEALLRAGESAEARAAVDRLERVLRDRDTPLARPAVAHARGLLATAAGDWPAAAAEFVAAAEGYAHRHCPYEAAQARELAARHLAADQPDRASVQLRAALDGYQRLGAGWDAARARRTAREHGIPIPGPHRGGRRGYGNRLSPRERAVAELAAGSRTNREIADELFLSVKTVERHVTVAMRKLGVSSRRAIAGALAAPPPPAAGANLRVVPQ